MSWETAVVGSTLGVAGLLLWFATKQAENWFGTTMKVLFIILGLFALQTAGSTSLAMVNVANNTLALSTAQYTLLEDGPLSQYRIMYYGIWTFIAFFLMYYLYEVGMVAQDFIHNRRRKREDGEEFGGE